MEIWKVLALSGLSAGFSPAHRMIKSHMVYAGGLLVLQTDAPIEPREEIRVGKISFSWLGREES